ncbi:MAG: pseudouridine synthase [Candidatus Peregrinibacteria bacterium]
MVLMRLNKHLAQLGLASRREADRWIEAGQVKVNGKTVTQLGTKVDSDTDKVEVSQKAHEAREKLIYIALNKPVGYTSSAKRTTMDPKIVTDLVDIPQRVYPVGRLDKDTTGLLILTNDGTLTFALTHPSAECEKEYEVVVKGAITKGAMEKLETGVKLWGERTLPTHVKKIGRSVIRVTLREGKNRQIRRICQKVGYPVRTLKRIRIKSLMLGDLPLGQWRFLGPEEVKKLRA